jgi:hypothetical protein
MFPFSPGDLVQIIVASVLSAAPMSIFGVLINATLQAKGRCGNAARECRTAARTLYRSDKPRDDNIRISSVHFHSLGASQRETVTGPIGYQGLRFRLRRSRTAGANSSLKAAQAFSAGVARHSDHSRRRDKRLWPPEGHAHDNRRPKLTLLGHSYVGLMAVCGGNRRYRRQNRESRIG